MVAARPDPAAKEPKQGLSEAAEAEWRRLRKQIDFAVEFWLAFAFLPSPHDATVMRERASAMLAVRGRSMLVVSPKTPDELRSDVLPILFGEEAGAAGCVWIEAIERDPYGEVSSPWGTAWTWLAMRMNERRDALRRHLQGGLVLVGPPEIKPHVRESASDLWSVRSIVIEVQEEPKTSSEVVIAPPHEEAIKIVAVSPPMQSVMQSAQRFARTRAHVLLIGEPGTGKSLLARWIHEHSARAHHPLVTVNCAAIPETLIDSVLFGHVRGAFSGAIRDQPGCFAAADGGTLFLDEVSDLPSTAQSKLLRTIQTGEIQPIGSSQPLHVDVRIIAATAKDLHELPVEVGVQSFFRRLSSFAINVSPLRDRREDIRPLAEHFLEHTKKVNGSDRTRGFDRDALALLERYSWPGNVQELQDAISRAVTFCDGDWIEVGDLPERMRSTAEPWTGGLKTRLHRAESEILVEALEKARWNQAEAARLLEIPRRALILKMRAHGIRRPDK